MANEVRTRACAACGWPALAGTRRCPYCRAPFPRVPRGRRQRTADPLQWLALAWTAAMVPTVLLALAILGVLPALLALGVSLTPVLFVWLLRRRSAMRIGRFQRRTPRPRRAPQRSSEDPSVDTRRR